MNKSMFYFTSPTCPRPPTVGASRFIITSICMQTIVVGTYQPFSPSHLPIHRLSLLPVSPSHLPVHRLLLLPVSPSHLPIHRLSLLTVLTSHPPVHRLSLLTASPSHLPVHRLSLLIVLPSHLPVPQTTAAHCFTISATYQFKNNRCVCFTTSPTCPQAIAADGFTVSPTCLQITVAD